MIVGVIVQPMFIGQQRSRTSDRMQHIPLPGDWCTITYYEQDVQVIF